MALKLLALVFLKLNWFKIKNDGHTTHMSLLDLEELIRKGIFFKTERLPQNFELLLDVSVVMTIPGIYS